MRAVPGELEQGGAVDLGTLVLGPALDHAVLHGLDEDRDGLADALLGPLGVELLDEGGDVLGAGPHLVLVELAVVRRGLGAVLVGVAEDSGHVHARGLEEVAQRLQVVLRLAGEADDHVGADAGQRRQVADAREQVQEALRVAEAAHPAQHAGAGVLEGEVEVGHDARGVRDRLDQARTRLGGLEVGHPHPVDALDRGELGEHRLEQAQVAEVLAVRRGVLADEEELAHALGGQPLALGQDVAGPAAHERATEAGDRAERAAAVAAAGQLERGHRPGVEPAAYGAGSGGRAPPHRSRRRRSGAVVGVTGHRDRRGVAVDGADRQQPAPVGRRVRVVRLPRHDRAQPGGDVGVVVEAEDGVGLGKRLGEVLAVALGQATDGDDGLRAAGLLEVGGLEQGVDRVLLGGLDEAAGVDHDGVGVLGVGDEHEAVGLEAAGQLLGVDLVAGAAQGHHRHVEGGAGDDAAGVSRSDRHRTREYAVSVRG